MCCPPSRQTGGRYWKLKIGKPLHSEHHVCFYVKVMQRYNPLSLKADIKITDHLIHTTTELMVLIFIPLGEN